MRIMIVEDDAEVATFLCNALEIVGHEATSFAHGGFAVGAIARSNFELLICDLMLPNVSGIDTIKMARGQFPYLPVIVVSALDKNEWEPKVFEAGAAAFLQKPVRANDLVEQVELIEKSQPDLTIGVLDPDKEHAARLAQGLETMGCTVHAYVDFNAMAQAEESGDFNVLVVDGRYEGAKDAMGWANERDMATVACEPDTPDFNQDKLMRQGASFCLVKPVDVQSLVTQSRFFVSPVPASQRL